MVNSAPIETNIVPPLINIVLESTTVRQRYNLTLKLYKKLESVSSKIHFLEECLKHGHIPNSFKLPNKLNPTQSQNKTQINNVF